MATLVFHVEDEPDIVAAVEYGLRRAGFDTRYAFSGGDALTMLENGLAPDVVLLDVMLPDLSGIEICRRLRADAACRDVPIVMLTARAEESDRVAGFEAGADDYVVKPFSVRELVCRVRALARRSGAEPAA